MLLLLLAAQVSAAETRFDACVALTRSDPAAARTEAGRWQMAGGGYFARACAGLAFAAEENWIAAAGAFADAARAAELARDVRAANYHTQAGNAWLAAGDAAKAQGEFSAALASGTLTGPALGEVQLDLARALVAGGSLPQARIDLDRALVNVPADPLAWLLSATLARRMDDRARAAKDIAEALRRAPDDASVQLEAGNIAAQAGDEAGARRGWEAAVRAAPDTDTARRAEAALAQFR